MAIGDFLAAIGRRWWLVVAATVVAATIGFTLATTATPTYAATAQVMAVALDTPTRTEGGSELTRVLAAEELIRARITEYVSIADTESFWQGVVEAHVLPMTRDQLSRSLTMSSPNDTAIIGVTVRSRSPVMAADVSNASAEQLAEVLQVREKMIPFRAVVTEYAKVPESPIAPELGRTVAQSAVLGLIIGITAATGLQLVRERRELRELEAV